MSFQSLAAELTGVLPGLSPFLADTYINRAWIDIQRARLWSFLEDECGIFCPVQTTAGAIAITQFSTLVTCDADASEALLAIALPADQDLTSLQIRFGGSSGAAQVGQVYSIADFDDADPTALVLTLDRIMQQATNATAGYQCYKAYIKPTVDDFLKWTSVVDVTNGWWLRLNYTSEAFDRRDPQRQAQGLGYYLGAFKGNPSSQPRPQYEVWPHPTSGQSFYGRYKRSGSAFTAPADELPPIIPDALVMARALGWYGCPWALDHVGEFPMLKGTNWVASALMRKKEYAELLLDAKRQDDEQQLQTVWARGHGLIHSGQAYFKGMVNFPIDSNFMQSHLVNF